jgi:hypothetical protein
MSSANTTRSEGGGRLTKVAEHRGKAAVKHRVNLMERLPTNTFAVPHELHLAHEEPLPNPNFLL